MTRHGLSGVCGVYKITNLITGEFYIGASVDVASRINQHFTTAMKKYKDINSFYSDIAKYGRENFAYELLEECNREEKLSKELYWYNKLKPTYNFTVPCACPFTDEKVKKKSQLACENSLKRLEAHRSEHCVNACRESQRHRMVACQGYNGDEMTPVFESYTNAYRWLNTEAKATSVISHIVRSIKTGQKAYGWHWKKVGE